MKVALKTVFSAFLTTAFKSRLEFTSRVCLQRVGSPKRSAIRICLLSQKREKLPNYQEEFQVLLKSQWNFRTICLLTQKALSQLGSGKKKSERYFLLVWLLQCLPVINPLVRTKIGARVRGISPYDFHSLFSIFSRLKLEHSRLIYESLWISVLKQLQLGFLFFSLPDFC